MNGNDILSRNTINDSQLTDMTFVRLKLHLADI